MQIHPHLLNLSAYIDQNLEKDLPLSSLAKRVGLSPFHFHRKFGAYFGESLHQHIKRLRLERAAFALRHGSTSVRQIARDSGYKTVSAFSHAFSGFAGASPTRYRSLGSSDGKQLRPQAEAFAIKPSWIGDIDARSLAFIRSRGKGHGTQEATEEAIDHFSALAGPLEPATLDGDREAGRLPFVVASSDIYRVTNGDDFRVDVGIDADRIRSDRRGLLGMQTLPGGRYARFDFHCRSDEVVAHCVAAALGELHETPRLTQHFVRFDPKEKDADGRRRYCYYLPLTA